MTEGAAETSEGITQSISAKEGAQMESKETLPPAGISGTEAIKRMAEGEGEIRGGAPGWLEERGVKSKDIKHPELKSLVERLDRRHLNMLSHNFLIDFYTKIDGIEVAPKSKEEDWRNLVLAAIAKYDEENFPPEKPEIKGPEKIKPPETDELTVKEVIDRVFNLVNRGITEKKDFDGQFNEYPKVQRLLEELGEGRGPSLDELGPDEKTRVRNKELNAYLATKYSKGVYLKERLEIFTESMRRLQKRYLEVIDADGSLAGLRVQEVSKGFAQNIKTQLTTIEPLDWYVLTHLDDLFPEGGNDPNPKVNQEYKINIERAWEVWQKIGADPYKDDGKGGWKPKDIEINGEKIKKSTTPKEKYYTLKDYYTNERLVRAVRDKISGVVGRRAEQLTNMFLTVSLTYDMWDRERWKIQTVGEARDLMIFDLKRIRRLKNERTGEGIPYSVGLFWADEDQGYVFTNWVTRPEPKTDEEKEIEEKKTNEEKEEDAEKVMRGTNPQLWESLRRIKDMLIKNQRRALFMNSGKLRTEGTLIGDYWHSAKIKDGKRDKKLSEFESPREIPWLEMHGLEAKTYSSYFEYSLALAASLRELIMKTDYKPPELVDPSFWREVVDKTHRLGDYCPSVIARNRDKEGRELDEVQREALKRKFINKCRRLIAESILWLGSYQAQADPDAVFQRGIYSNEMVWGKKIFIVGTASTGIMGAIKESGLLDDNNYRILEKVAYGFNFETKGAKT